LRQPKQPQRAGRAAARNGNGFGFIALILTNGRKAS
jgi:hypothetical protein